MRRSSLTCSFGLCFTALLPPASGQDAPRSAAEIVREFDRVAMPSFSDGADEGSVRRFREAIERGCLRKAELAAELQRDHPDHPRLPRLLATRWAGLTNALGRADDVRTELDGLLTQKGLRDDVRHEALRARARAAIESERCSNLQRLDALQATLDLPGDYAFAAACLTDFVERRVADPETQRSLYEIAVAKWPGKPYGGRPAKAWLAVLDGIGKPIAELLPADVAAQLAEATAAPCEFTVLQLWSGWIDERSEHELAAFRALREQHGARLRLIGLLNADLAERLPAAREAGFDWPQIAVEDPEPMVNPLRLPRYSGCLLLDRELRLVGVLGSAALVAERIEQLQPAAVR